MIRRLALASSALVVLTVPARADPIFTPLLTSAFLSAGLTGSVFGVGTAAIAASITSAIIVTAIGIGLTLLFAPKPPKPENGTIAVQQAVPFRIFGYGTTRVAGALVFKEESGGYLGYVAVLNGHKISAFQGLYLNDDLVTVPISAGAIDGIVAQGSDKRYQSGHVSIDTRIGNVPEVAYSLITQYFGSVWDTTFRGDGCASIAMICAPAKAADFSTTFPYGAPIPTPIIDQYCVYDPRDPTQDPTNSSTWQFSDNPALCVLHYQCFSDYGSRRIYATAILPVVAQWIQAANDCDDIMPLKSGGNEKRYRLGGWTTTEQDRRSNLQLMLATCDGWLCERGDGTLILKVGKYSPPTVTLTDDDILGFTIQRDVASEDKINQATAKYTSPECGYASVETSPLVDTVDQAARPGAPRAAQMDLSWVHTTGQASRLLKREMVRQGEKTRGSLTLRLSGINAGYERWVTIASNTIPRLNGVVLEVTKTTLNLASQTIDLAFIGSGPQIDAYTPATEESAPPTVPQRPATVGLPIPANVAASPAQVNDPSGNSSIYLTVSWDLPLNNGNPWTGIVYQVQFRLSNVGGSPGPWSPQTFDNPTISGSRVSVATGSVPAGTLLDVQVFSVATGASLSTGSSIVQVSTAISYAAPGVPNTLTATPSSGHIALACGNPSSASFAGVQFYRSAVGGTFASATAVGTEVFGVPGGISNQSAVLAAGTYWFWVTALSNGGAASSALGPVAATVT